MCGIAGLYLKTPALGDRLGAELSKMLTLLSDRGPDSAGVALYRDPAPPGHVKLSLQVIDGTSPGADWAAISDGLGEAVAGPVSFETCAGHAIFFVPGDAATAQAWLSHHAPAVSVMGSGQVIEIYKGVGTPREALDRFGISGLAGSHGIGHTRMATESRVTTEGSHPFSTGADLCLVHNGSLSNHNRLRRDLQREGIAFGTDCDSEVAAGYLTWRLREGATLEQALEGCLADLDGFFTFAVGTAEGFAVLRDPIACKPAVMAETDDWVAIASEYRAIAALEGAEDAETWEPEPGRVYSWGSALVA
ncbi:glutamine amidotransferase family protein [Conexibacter sp. DBS9H8]|uniref:class II glutamine amidotransferase n=1 Tax=Conexibacter sp. DBS9H8 TaxID=2937801 RepID=UPI0020100BE7|nr:glutamine amidotransferase family protein [Conexibacter sp. DBS9H8]